MRKSRFAERQIVVVLKQAGARVSVQDLIRKHGISEQTFYRWRKQYGGLGASELQQLKQLREENRRLKSLVAELPLDCAPGRPGRPAASVRAQPSAS
jgi:putative transposase